MENTNKEIRLKYLRDLLTKFKRNKKYFQALYLGSFIFVLLFETFYCLSLIQAVMYSTLGTIIYAFLVCFGAWLGVADLKSLLKLDFDEKVLEALIETENKKPN